MELSEKAEAVLRYLENGHYMTEACRLARVSPKTVRAWLAQAQKDEEAGIETQFTAFAERVARAEAKLEERQLSRIEAAASEPKGWTAAAWLLERRFPQRWSLRNRVELAGADGEPVQVVVKFAQKKAKDDEDGDTGAAETA